MAVEGAHAREVVFKVVLHGPGLGGKTTSLRHVHATTGPLRRGSLLELATAGERTVAFDFLPLRLPRLDGRDVRLELFTVPGQSYYPTARRLVLSGVDGVVFVGDSRAGDALARTEESLAELRGHLADQGRSLAEVPHVFQWNKQDLDDAASVASLRARFDPDDRAGAHVGSVATRGEGVFEALDAIVERMARASAPELGELGPLREPGARRPSLGPPPGGGVSFVPLFAPSERALAARVEALLAEGRAELAVPLVDELVVRGLARAAARTSGAPEEPAAIAARLGVAPSDYARVRQVVRGGRAGASLSGRDVLSAYAVAVHVARSPMARA